MGFSFIVIVSQNKKYTRQQAADSMSNTTRRSNAVDFLFWLAIHSRGQVEPAYLQAAAQAVAGAVEDDVAVVFADGKLAADFVDVHAHDFA